MARPPFTRILEALPKSVPFVAPEALERRMGHPLPVRLGANESMFGISPVAKRAMEEAVSSLYCYGDPESFDLRHAIAKRHGVPFENIAIGSGIDDLLALTVRSLIEPGQPVVTSLGGYPTFSYFAEGYGAAIHRVPYKSDRCDLEGLLVRAHETAARLVYLANPDNPSGTWHPAADVVRFSEAMPGGSTLILDEAYSDFAPREAIPELDAEHPRVIRMMTFSKVWGLAGARVGYAIAARETVEAWEKIRAHFGVNLVGQVGALASLSDPAFAEGVVASVKEGREDYVRIAREAGFRPLPSATNFVAMDVGSFDRAKSLVQKLLERDVFIRMPGAPPLNSCIRVSVGRREQRAAFEAALKSILAAGG
jgi:histidinol-phosphate aminotransferase